MTKTFRGGGGGGVGMYVARILSIHPFISFSQTSSRCLKQDCTSCLNKYSIKILFTLVHSRAEYCFQKRQRESEGKLSKTLCFAFSVGMDVDPPEGMLYGQQKPSKVTRCFHIPSINTKFNENIPRILLD